MMRKVRPGQRAEQPLERPLPRKSSSPWRAGAIALAAALAIGLPAHDAFALALGRVTVQSPLGEPLRAEIDIPQITAEEASSLRATLASPAAFRAAGMERSAALADLQITLQQRANGGYYLRLASNRPVTEPFLDLILEASWSSGRVVRDYALLFDPPPARPAAPIAAQVAPAPAPAREPAQAQAAAPVAIEPLRPAAPQAQAAAAPAAAPEPGTPRTATPRASAPAVRAEAASRSVTVERGQTAGRIAAVNKPPTVSLDQMLVAMLRANPDAFEGNNVNRIKAGAIIELPTQEQAAAVGASDARRIVMAQSQDFGEFRRRLAEGVANTPQAGTAPSRQAAGRLEAQVQEKKPAEAAPDKLTLSKGAIKGPAPAGKSAEERVARERTERDAATRVAELNKNIAELNRLSAASGVAPTGPAPAPAPGLNLPSVAPAPAAAPASAPASAPAVAAAAASAAATAAESAASLPASVASGSAANPATAASRSVRTPTALPAPAATEGGLLAFVMDNPQAAAAAGGVLALLAGLGVLRLRRRKQNQQIDSSFLESRLQPDSFFGGSGGQRIDTAEEHAPTGTSMVYSPSQIDAAGDVDPVAEADVYLAYGRDLQAEEILKEALRANPQRLAIHTKLLEIYARRRDVKAFERLAAEAHALTGGKGAPWSHIANLGAELDATNPLYLGGGELSLFDDSGHAPAPLPADSPLRALEQGLEPVPAAPGTPIQPPDTGRIGDSDEERALAEAAHAPLDFDLSAMESQSPVDSVGTQVDEPQMTATLPLVDAPRVPDLSESPAAPPPPAAPEEPLPALSLPKALMDLDLDIPSQRPPSRDPRPTPAPSGETGFDGDLAGDRGAGLPEIDTPLASEAGPAAEPATHPAAGLSPAAAPSTGMIDFDLSSISLDLDPVAERPAASRPGPEVAAAPEPLPDLEFPSRFPDLSPDLPGDLPGASTESDPLATKLALAEEFNAIGDLDGARSLAEEVLAEATGELRQRAERLLGELG